MRIELNIGLNVNGFESKNQGEKTLAVLELFFINDLVKVRKESSSVDRQKEKIEAENNMVVESQIKLTDLDKLALLPLILEQESIAVFIPEIGEGKLIFSRLYTGEKYDFNLSYFKRF